MAAVLALPREELRHWLFVSRGLRASETLAANPAMHGNQCDRRDYGSNENQCQRCLKGIGKARCEKHCQKAEHDQAEADYANISQQAQPYSDRHGSEQLEAGFERTSGTRNRERAKDSHFQNR